MFGKPLHHIAYASIRITLVHHITGECTVKGTAGKEGCHSYSKGRGNMGGVEEYTYQREGGGGDDEVAGNPWCTILQGNALMECVTP